MKAILNFSLSGSLTVLFMLGTVALFNDSVSAQGTVIRKVGIAGKMDKDSRSPDLGVRTATVNGAPTIYVDAHIPNPVYRIYPIQFDIYVNRHLQTTQIRSPELPGPIGLTVGESVASPPFNYAVVAKVLTPNGRYFSSMIAGAFYTSNLLTTFDCTLTLDDGSGTAAEDYVVNDITTDQLNNNAISFAFEGDSVSGESYVDLSATINTAEEDQASGSLIITKNRDGLTRQSVEVSGTTTVDESGNLTGLSLKSEDELTVLVCS